MSPVDVWDDIREAYPSRRYPVRFDPSHNQQFWHEAGGTSAGGSTAIAVAAEHGYGGSQYQVELAAGNAGGTEWFNAWGIRGPDVRYLRLFGAVNWGVAGDNMVDADFQHLSFWLNVMTPAAELHYSISMRSLAGVLEQPSIWSGEGFGSWIALATLPWPSADAQNQFTIDAILDLEAPSYNQIALNGVEPDYAAYPSLYPDTGAAVAAETGRIELTCELSVQNTGDLNTVHIAQLFVEQLDIS